MSEPNDTSIAICRAWTDPNNCEISVAVSDTNPRGYDDGEVKIQYSSLTVGQAQQGIRTHLTNTDKSVDAAGMGKTFIVGIISLLRDGSQIEPLVQGLSASLAIAGPMLAAVVGVLNIFFSPKDVASQVIDAMKERFVQLNRNMEPLSYMIYTCHLLFV